jgi:hypothetical protein
VTGCNDRLDVMIGWIGHVSYDLGFFLSDIELIVLCAFICRVGYFDAQISETSTIKVGGFDLHASLGNETNYVYGIKL